LVFGLCGFAFAQPLFDLLGKNPTFFVAHNLDGLALVAFALGVLIVPALALFSILVVARLASRWLRAPVIVRVTRAGIVGFLVAVTLLPPLQRAFGLGNTTWIALGVVILIGAGLAYDHLRALRTFVSYLMPAPVLFLVIFLFFTPVNTLITSSDPAAAAVDLQGTRTPIVEIVFDEFALGGLLDANGHIDATRYPGFARLAATSTWYSDATTVSGQTLHAVPAVLSGLIPSASDVPVAADYPHSVFTLFGRSHHLHDGEAVTRLCPKQLCNHQTSTTTADLASDLQTVYLRTALPDDLATQWNVPTIGDRWAGFDDHAASTLKPTTPHQTTKDFDSKIFDAAGNQDQAARFQRFLASLGKGRAPGLWLEHVLLPHVPYQRLPDGRPYNGSYVPAASFYSPPQLDLVHVDAERFVLQTEFVDQLMNEFLDRLHQTKLFKNALVVVTADHGVAFVPGQGGRSTDDQHSRDQVLPVPLFVKYPGQTTGKVDARDARTIDVLPTVADALGVKLPPNWHFDGRSLLSHDQSRRPQKFATADGTITYPGIANPQHMASELATFLSPGGHPHDAFRVGPYGALVGQPAAALVHASATGSVTLDDGAAYASINLDGVVPALLTATVTGVDPGQWIAVALNGTIAGVGPAYEYNGDTRVEAMLDDTLMRSGANTIDVYRIDDSGRALRSLRPSG
jgi:hypothetical protein